MGRKESKALDASQSQGLVAPLLAGVEVGGTKVVCVIASEPPATRVVHRIEVTDPESTTAAVLDFFAEQDRNGLRPAALGIGSFGPIELRPQSPLYGRITTTPKPGWSGFDILGSLRRPFSVPVAFDTDVNAAALGEGRWGSARGLASFVYLTIGTGIGGGVVVDGQVLRGLGHPEIGHIGVPRHPRDRFAGRCPFHGDCFEGLACGPAIADRFGKRAEELQGAELDEAVTLVAWYLAAAIAIITFTLAPERIIVGGGISMLPGLFNALGPEVASRIGQYPGYREHYAEGYVVPAGLGQMAGPAGTLILAEQALHQRGA